MKYKAKKSYASLSNSDNFLALGSASTHLILKAGEVAEFNGEVPDKIKECLNEVKENKKQEVSKVVTSKSKENK